MSLLFWKRKGTNKVIHPDCYQKLPISKKVLYEQTKNQPTHYYRGDSYDDGLALIEGAIIGAEVANLMDDGSSNSGSSDTSFGGFGGGDFGGAGAGGDWGNSGSSDLGSSSSDSGSSYDSGSSSDSSSTYDSGSLDSGGGW
jgi:hypothetical protein